MFCLTQTIDGLPTAQTCFFQLRLPQYTSQQIMAERLRYAVRHCRSIDMDNYMLRRNTNIGVGGAVGIDSDDSDYDDYDDDDDEDDDLYD